MFKFKQFTIHQDKVAMKVGTDAVLLGSWTDVNSVSHALDIGTGTGVLALMIAQRNSTTFIDGIDIDINAIEQAKENVLSSPWTNRIHILHADLHNFYRECKKSYDLIICNPPYFSNGFPVANRGRNVARVAENLEREVLIPAMQFLLSDTGKLSIILPTGTAEKFIAQALASGLHCIRKTKVYSKTTKPPIRILMEFTKQLLPLQENVFVIEGNIPNTYSDAFIKLTHSFYLQF